jgi:predicted carbohydrate-binding protein with CBM5 and CBM33 domain
VPPLNGLSVVGQLSRSSPRKDILVTSIRRVAAVAAATVMAVGTGIVVLVAAPSPASAHGATVFPGSRQYLCWVDGLTETGQINPGNPACDSVHQQAGINAFYNWFANLDSNGQGRTVGYVPDGEICSGGNRGPFDFSPYSQARTDFPRTNVTAGATYEFRSNNWAAHPGRFDIYVTRQGYNPSAPLTWSSLELIDTVQDPPQSGGPGGLEYYFWDTTLPSNRSGLHMVFIHWVRSDSPENFYSCSDVDFNNGNGEVIGIGGDPGEPDPGDPGDCPSEAPSTPGPAIVTNITSTTARASWGASSGCVTSYELVNVAGGANQVLATVTGNPPSVNTTLTGLTPNTSYAVSVRARNANTGAVSALSDDAPFNTPATDPEPEPGDCTVSYGVTSQWNPGFQAEVTITNDSGAGINGWDLEWSYENGQQITQLWGGIDTQAGADVSVGNESWNGNIGANGGSVSFGFLGTWSGANAEPDAFTLNGEACTVA